MKFVKMHGAGNDYVYVNGFETEVKDISSMAKKVSDRHKGIGSDGLVMILPPEKSTKASVRMRMFNSDGSEAEMCGNAIRCVGKFSYENKLVNSTKFFVETLAGDKELELFLKNDKVTHVTVDMGIPYWNSKEIPVDVKESECLNYPLEIGGTTYTISCVSVGNPHAVIFVDNVVNLELEKIGPLIECHSLFPKRINVEFVQIYDREHVRMRVWERGAGETEACGTGACATALICAKLGHTERAVDIALNGGNLKIDWRDNDHIFMTGEACLVFEGEFYEN